MKMILRRETLVKPWRGVAAGGILETVARFKITANGTDSIGLNRDVRRSVVIKYTRFQWRGRPMRTAAIAPPSRFQRYYSINSGGDR